MEERVDQTKVQEEVLVFLTHKEKITENYVLHKFIIRSMYLQELLRVCDTKLPIFCIQTNRKVDGQTDRQTDSSTPLKTRYKYPLVILQGTGHIYDKISQR